MCWVLRCLVAFPSASDLLLCAKDLFVTAIVGGLRCDLVNEGAEGIRERLCAFAQPQSQNYPPGATSPLLLLLARARIAPAHEGPRNESNNKAHETTSARSTHYGNGHLIRVFHYTGHIFS